jgi:hypothetical protein
VQRFKVLGLALMTVFALSAIVSAAASAELPVILNNKKEVAGAVKFTGNNTTKTELVKLNGLKVECSGNTDEGEFEAKKPLGLFHIKFTGCKGLVNLVTCTGLGDTSGTILVLGTFHIVYDKLGTGEALGAAVLFLLEEVHFSCSLTLVRVKGEVLCLISPINKLAKKAKVTCEQSGGDPKEVVYWNAAGSEVNIKEGLLASENMGAFEMSAEGGSGEIETTSAEEVEIMA